MQIFFLYLYDVQVTYMLSDITRSIYGSIIGIDRDSGVIRVIGEIDYERDPVIELSIIAADAGLNRRTALTRAVIHVADHNDEPPSLSIDVPSASGLGHVTEGEVQCRDSYLEKTMVISGTATMSYCQ